MALLIHHLNRTCDGSDIEPGITMTLAQDDDQWSIWLDDQIHCVHGELDELKAWMSDREPSDDWEGPPQPEYREYDEEAQEDLYR